MTDIIDSIEVRLHADFGQEVLFTVWEDQTGLYHAEAEEDPDTVEFLKEYYPDELDTYRQKVAGLPDARSTWLETINSYFRRYTYNGIRPLVEDEDNWLELDENELMKD
jgi:hypothetical protein